MTFAQALNALKETRTLSTNLLAPLGISFENFLRFAQVSSDRQEALLDKLIVHLEALNACPNNEAFHARNR
tara:strand:- start:96 stop:308 length:213 start_codon:yes stop_codon:yes gene_type:complete